MIKKIEIKKEIIHPKTFSVLKVGATLEVDVKDNFWLRRFADGDAKIVVKHIEKTKVKNKKTKSKL